MIVCKTEREDNKNVLAILGGPTLEHNCVVSSPICLAAEAAPFGVWLPA